MSSNILETRVKSLSASALNGGATRIVAATGLGGSFGRDGNGDEPTAVAGAAGLWLGRQGPGIAFAMLRDFQLMMIGPLWLLSVIYKRFRIPF